MQKPFSEMLPVYETLKKGRGRRKRQIFELKQNIFLVVLWSREQQISFSP